jgi:uncharacterized protein YkwD
MKTVSAMLMAFFLGFSSLQATEDEGLKKLLELINQERVAQGKAVLQESAELMGVAWEWSYRMAKEKRLSHRKNLLELCEKYDYRFMNENLHMELSEFDPEKTVKSWMESPAHKRNLLEDKISLMGVGYSKAEDGTIFVVFNGAARTPQ